jgi:hypothetical protein
MKRRQFIISSAGAVAGLAVQGARSATPCMPPSVNVVSGTSTTASCGSAGSSPAWFSSMADKTWSSVAASATVSAVNPNVGTQAAVMTAWGGAVVDTQRESLVIPAQGGHSDYGGNEVYALSLNAASPAWARITDPSSFTGADPTSGPSNMPDGRPRAAHSEGHIVYAANVDKVMLTSMPYYWQNGNSAPDMYAFDRPTLSWSKKASMPNGWGDNSYYHGGGVYDPTTGMVWTVSTTSSSGSVSKYNPLTNTHTLYATRNAQGYDCSICIAPSRGIIVVLNGSATSNNGAIVWMNVNSPSAGWNAVTNVSGTPLTANGSGLVWHDPSGAFIGWGSGTDLVKLVPPTNLSTGAWVWSTIVPAASNTVTPNAPQPNGTYGRFNILNNFAGSGQSCIVLVNAVDARTYVYKVPAAGL